MTTTTEQAAGRKLTGWHVLAIVGGFFGVIFAANAALVIMALSTFSGVEVASSYKAGQEFPDELERARRQAELGWVVSVTPVLGEGGRLELAVDVADREGRPVYELAVSAILEHPADRRRDVALTLAAHGAGHYVASADGVEPGPRHLVIELDSAGERVFLSRNTLFLKVDGR
mgnify:CR=1 FL=1